MRASAIPRRPRALGVTTEETAAWRDAADAVHVPYDEELGVHQQCEGFTPLREWDFTDNTRAIRCCCTSPTCGCTRRR